MEIPSSDSKGKCLCEETFTNDLLKRLLWVCDKHIKSSATSKRRRLHSIIHNGEKHKESIESSLASGILSDVFSDFARCLQNGTSLYNTFDLLAKSSKLARDKQNGVLYCMWNRLPKKRHKNIHYKLLSRRLDPCYQRNTDTLRDEFLMACKTFKRCINVWGHHKCLGEIDTTKSYNEPPQVHVIKFDKLGDIIITGGDEGIIKLWHTFNCKLIMSLKKHSGGITSIDVHTTNSFIISSCDGGEIWLWEINGNFYRPHKVIKSNFKILWVRFVTSITSSERDVHTHEKNWNDIIKNTRVISVDANSNLKIYLMEDLISSSSGDNIYKTVNPIYKIDLFNHNINSYDVSKVCLPDGSHFIALGIDSLNSNPDPDGGNFNAENDVASALSIINDANCYGNIQQPCKSSVGLYNKLTDLSGFCLFKTSDSIDKQELVETVSVPNKNDKEILSNSDEEPVLEDKILKENLCQCDADLEGSVNYSNICVLCDRAKSAKTQNKFKCGTGKILDTDDIKDGTEKFQQEKHANPTFNWYNENCSFFEKYLRGVIEPIPHIASTVERPEYLNITGLNIPIGRLTSTVVMSHGEISIEHFQEADPGDFDPLIVSYVTDSHESSPDVCFSNHSMNHVTASDDGKIFLWIWDDNSHSFNKVRLITKTLDKWIGGKTDKQPEYISERDTDLFDEELSTPNARYNRHGDDTVQTEFVIDVAFATNQVPKSQVSLFSPDVETVPNSPNVYNNTENNSPLSSKRGSTKTSNVEQSTVKGSLRENGHLYVMMNITWSKQDTYLCIADSVVSKSNIKKMITNARTIVSGVSIFDNNGGHICDILHKEITHHISCVSPHPVFEDFLLVATYDGNIFILSISNCAVVRKISCGSHAVWLDIEWHPQGHIFAASQKFGCFSLFSIYGDNTYGKTQNFQCGYNEFYCNIQSFSSNAYSGPELPNIQLRKYYYGFSSAPPLTMEGISTSSSIHCWGVPPPQIILDEFNNPVEVPAPAPSTMQVKDGFAHSSQLINAISRLPFPISIGEFIKSHIELYSKDDLPSLLKKFLSFYSLDTTDARLEGDEKTIRKHRIACPFGGIDCIICGYIENHAERSNRYASLKDSALHIKSILNDNGDIVTALPLSARPAHLVALQMPLIIPTVVEDPVPHVSEVPCPTTVQEPEEVTVDTDSNEERSEDDAYEDTVEEQVQDDQPEENKTSNYSFRAKRGSLDYKRDRELELAKQLGSRIGPIDLSKMPVSDISQDVSSEHFCLLCGLGTSEYSHGVMSRLQTLKLTQTLFKHDNSLHPGGSKLSRNLFLGPVNIAKRFINQLLEFSSVSRRVESLRSESLIFVHTSCLASSSLMKLDSSKKRIINLPEVVVKASQETCSFCNSDFATVYCSGECGAVYHYPCAVALYKSQLGSSSGKYENIFRDVIHIPDPLTCDEFLCLDCLRDKSYDSDAFSNYLTGKSFANSTPRDWLSITKDSIDVDYVPQIGDLVVLMPSSFYGSAINIGNLWKFSSDTAVLLKIKDIDYRFIGPLEGRSFVSAVLLMEKFPPVDEDCPDITVYYTPGFPIVLLRDVLLGVRRLLGLNVGDSISVRLNGTWKQAKIKNIRVPETVGHDSRFTLEDVDLESLETIVKLSSVMGTNAVQIEPLPDFNQQWISAWDVFVEDEQELGLIKNISECVLPKEDLQVLINITLDEKFAPFFTIEEYREQVIETSEDEQEDWIKIYWMTISRPIGLDEIRERVLNGYYRRCESLYHDMKLVVNNCEEFNVSTSDIVKLANEFSEQIDTIRYTQEDEYKTIIKHLWPEISHLYGNTPPSTQKPVDKVKVQYKDDEFTENTRKRHSSEIYENTRRSQRLLTIAKKQEIEAQESGANSRARKTRYNLRS
ncbi:conserved hypothetical protein [Theileria equi strain WA]|uniref:Bromo domain-containing protein n=1 Tax=Theileria equi strain WA TaxID=1537102 RepID=L1LGC9_THEEQ|nr:conserved hypothetical protein [Theileria equi strain WA]EKX74203.1 conserved hypothetical protein [Theileria equi strain WA]|eukprot:XP_004833655.1 conserved hypothetical protein [Theileria equi strain WA]